MRSAVACAAGAASFVVVVAFAWLAVTLFDAPARAKLQAFTLRRQA